MLEISTAAHIYHAMAIYPFWWWKPRDVAEPIIVRIEKDQIEDDRADFNNSTGGCQGALINSQAERSCRSLRSLDTEGRRSSVTMVPSEDNVEKSVTAELPRTSSIAQKDQPAGQDQSSFLLAPLSIHSISDRRTSICSTESLAFSEISEEALMQLKWPDEWTTFNRKKNTKLA